MIQNNKIIESLQTQETNYRELLMSYLSKWKIFVLLLIVCIGSAHIYLRYANPLYEANATILIKNSQKIGTGMSETSVFEDLSVFGESQSIENEKSILNSRNIMRKVIMNLGIRHEYYSLGTVTGFNRFEQYNNAPIRIEFQYEDTISFINTRHQLKLKIENEKKYFGRDEYFNSIIVKSDEDLTGKIKNVKILESNKNTLFGEIITNYNQKINRF